METGVEQLKPVSREQLQSAANQMFESRGITFTRYIPHNDPRCYDGLLNPDVATALLDEKTRAINEAYANDKAAQKMWNQRPVGRKLLDLMRGRDMRDLYGLPSPRAKITSGCQWYVRQASDNIDATVQGRPYPAPLRIELQEKYIEGMIVINGQEFVLDPSKRLLSATVVYPLSDGTRADIAVTHTLTADREEVTSQTREYFGDNWSGVPPQPFSDQPMESSHYLLRAFELLMVKTD